ncbi:alpha-E domain-containing protein, partial [Pseudotabrizicola sp.]
KIAHFLILNPQCPRSLITCVEGMTSHLDRLSRGYQRKTFAQDRARSLQAELAELRVEDIFEEGLHEFLSRFIGDMARAGSVIRDCYLNGDVR